MTFRELYKLNLSWNKHDKVLIEVLKADGYLFEEKYLKFKDAFEFYGGYETIAFAENRVVLKEESK